MTELRRDEPTPLYYQLEMLLRRAIEMGEFPEGRLPTEEALAKHHGVSRLTVRGALRRLEEDGLILRQRARGTFVCQETRRSNFSGIRIVMVDRLQGRLAAPLHQGQH